MRRGGFTIVELLIVIVVIAILATITIVAYNGIQLRGQAAAIASDLRAADKSFRLYKEASGMSTWTIDTDASWNGSTGGNPTLASIIAYMPALHDFLQKSPSNAGFGTASGWLYDNDNDTYSGCAANTAGVNLVLQNITNTSLALAVDQAIDDGNLSCGMVRLSGTSFTYGLDKSP